MSEGWHFLLFGGVWFVAALAAWLWYTKSVSDRIDQLNDRLDALRGEGEDGRSD
jgi:hypothetical protein